MELTLERRDQQDKTGTFAGGVVLMTPKIDEDYWAYRVRLSDKQAIVGFPKFSTIGIGFAVEEDWNTNFPYTVDTEETFQHIKHNKGDDAISDDDVRAAIALVQQAAGLGPFLRKGELTEEIPYEPQTIAVVDFAPRPGTPGPDPIPPFPPPPPPPTPRVDDRPLSAGEEIIWAQTWRPATKKRTWLGRLMYRGRHRSTRGAK